MMKGLIHTPRSARGGNGKLSRLRGGRRFRHPTCRAGGTAGFGAVPGNRDETALKRSGDSALSACSLSYSSDNDGAARPGSNISRTLTDAAAAATIIAASESWPFGI
jgi:hypothetical protein